MLAGVLREGHETARRHQTKRLRQQEDQQRPDDEDRHGEQERGDPGGDAIKGAAAMDRGIDAGGHADHERDQRPRQDQLQRARQPEPDLLDDGIVVDQRGAEIATRQSRQELAVLDQDRPVEPELLAQLLHRGRVGHRAGGREQQLGRVPRHHVQRQEHDRRNDPGHRQGQEKPPSEPGRAHPK